MNIIIRPTAAEDYPALTDIYNEQNEPHHQLTETAFGRGHQRALARGDRRLTALVDGEVVAMGMAGTRTDDALPGKFWGWFFVRPDHRHRGVDTALWDETVRLLDTPRSIWTCVRSDFIDAAGYLGERGYEERFRSWGANLDLGGFEADRFAHHERELREHGIHLHSYAELAAHARRDERLGALQAELEEQAPHFDPIIPRRHPRLDDEVTLIDSVVVAHRGEEYVGMASLVDGERSSPVAGSGFTGVRKPYRNLGIATAMKARTASWAKSQGYREVNSGGAGENAAILAVNRRLGFDVEPAWITLARIL